MNVDVHIAVAEFADAVFEFGGAAMGFAKAQVSSTSRWSSTKRWPSCREAVTS